jgi:hypothetical protein
MTEPQYSAPLKERMEGREYAHRAKGQNFDADLLAEAATEIEALRARCEAMEAKLSVYEAPSQTSGIGAGHVLYTLADAPTHDIANNGELHTLRCRICGVTGKQLYRAICTEAVARAALGAGK